jgi:hypothetical protein
VGKATLHHPNLTEPVIEVWNSLKSKTSRLIIIDITVFKKIVSTCLKETSPLLVAQMLKQCCSHMKVHVVQTCLLLHQHASPLENRLCDFTKPHIIIHNSSPYNNDRLIFWIYLGT